MASMNPRKAVQGRMCQLPHHASHAMRLSHAVPHVQKRSSALVACCRAASHSPFCASSWASSTCGSAWRCCTGVSGAYEGVGETTTNNILVMQSLGRHGQKGQRKGMSTDRQRQPIGPAHHKGVEGACLCEHDLSLFCLVGLVPAGINLECTRKTTSDQLASPELACAELVRNDSHDPAQPPPCHLLQQPLYKLSTGTLTFGTPPPSRGPCKRARPPP